MRFVTRFVAASALPTQRSDMTRQALAWPIAAVVGKPRMLLAAIGATLLTAMPPALADAPLPPPATVRILSPQGGCQAIAVPAPARIVVEDPSHPDRILWSLPFWNPNLLLSDDCTVLGAGYDEGALLVLSERSPNTVMMTFYRNGEITRIVRLGDLYADIAVLPRTASHWLWHRGTEWSGRTWMVHTVDGRVLSFTP